MRSAKKKFHKTLAILLGAINANVLMKVIIIFLVSSEKVRALKCVCNPNECEDVKSEDCPGKGYIVWDPCRCCKVCARAFGEACGGPGDFSGTCEPQLSCVSKIPVGGSGICLDIPVYLHLSGSYQNCSETVIVESGCEIINRKCKCWDRMELCKTKSITKWDFRNVEECQLNLANLFKYELDLDDDYILTTRKNSDNSTTDKQNEIENSQIKSDAKV
ncbi:cysteine-rich motor neuron 1 protein-like isoform X2 [Uranotaenia lowii]|uniref:cysteine-rich motor neuron 1 protein-like isoform X2 n=1 Tax=Uranotaenia lowii TaxID=190385 RepID=UPI002478FB96|nr:cysteine-rich motor neuron 1 protein-like isoform X2 [Uranotaenia lowii]